MSDLNAENGTGSYPPGQKPNRRDPGTIAQLLHAVATLIGKLTWALALLVVVLWVGHYIYNKDHSAKVPRSTTDRSAPAPPTIAWDKVDQAVAQAVQEAADAAEQHANRELDAWVAELQKKIDEDFLPWYFGYFTQQWLSLKALGYSLADTRPVERVFGDQPSAAERITKEIQKEFASRVLRPPIAQKRIERIAQTTFETFFKELEGRLSVVQQRYKIPKPEWENYLGDFALLTKNAEGNREVALPLKSLVGGGVWGLAVSVRALGAVRSLVEKIGKGITRRAATVAGEEAIEQVARRTAGKVAVEYGGKFVGPLVAVALIAWDLWDHYKTRKEQEPILRQNLFDYLSEVKEELLQDPEYGLITLIRNMEAQIIQQVQDRARRHPTTT